MREASREQPTNENRIIPNPGSRKTHSKGMIRRKIQPCNLTNHLGGVSKGDMSIQTSPATIIYFSYIWQCRVVFRRYLAFTRVLSVFVYLEFSAEIMSKLLIIWWRRRLPFHSLSKDVTDNRLTDHPRGNHLSFVAWLACSSRTFCQANATILFFLFSRYPFAHQTLHFLSKIFTSGKFDKLTYLQDHKWTRISARNTFYAVWVNE